MTPSPIPFGDLPRHSKRASQQYNWIGTDSLEAYRRNGGHPRYSDSDIAYELNSYGYRCPEFHHDAAIRVVSIGCSLVFGVGLPRHELFHELFCERLRSSSGLSVVNWNLGTPGASNDFLTLVLYQAAVRLKPDIVLINFTNSGRRDYISVDGERMTFNPSFKPTDRRHKQIQEHFASLGNPFDDQLNLLRNYAFVSATLRTSAWFFSFARSSDATMLDGHLHSQRYAGCMTLLDHARDNAHPGASSHMQLANAFWEAFNGSSWDRVGEFRG